MLLEILANTIHLTAMNIPDMALMPEGDFDIENTNKELKETYGHEDSSNLNFISL